MKVKTPFDWETSATAMSMVYSRVGFKKDCILAGRECKLAFTAPMKERTAADHAKDLIVAIKYD